jgi:hypothetical protein
MEIYVRFGKWKVRSLYREGLLTTVARELARCKLDLVGVQCCIRPSPDRERIIDVVPRDGRDSNLSG